MWVDMFVDDFGEFGQSGKESVGIADRDVVD